MVQEGLGLDVAGGGEIMTAQSAGADPAGLILQRREPLGILRAHGSAGRPQRPR